MNLRVRLISNPSIVGTIVGVKARRAWMGDGVALLVQWDHDRAGGEPLSYGAELLEPAETTHSGLSRPLVHPA
jgi:hypothetical protein